MQSPLHVKASELTYRFTSHGEIIPYLEIFPRIQIASDKCISRFPLLHSGENTTVASGDEVGVYLPEREDESCHLVLEAMSNQPRIKINPGICPICGAPLFESNIGIGRCVNKACRAQIYQHSCDLLRSLQIHEPLVYRVVRLLTAQGVLDSPASMFIHDLETLTAAHIGVEAAQIFLRNIHQIRGSVDISALLESLHLDDITNERISKISQYFADEKLTLKDIDKLFALPEINTTNWQNFISIPSNVRYLFEISQILAE